MYYLEPGQACALSMIVASRSEACEVMAKAVTETEVIAVPPEYIDECASIKPGVILCWKIAVHGLMKLLQIIDHIAFRNMDERSLYSLKRRKGALHSDILIINNTEIAQELTSSGEVISRLMKKLAGRGMIRLLKNQQVVASLPCKPIIIVLKLFPAG